MGRQPRSNDRSRSIDMSSDASIIRCICSYNDDDGFTIACDGCNHWQHGACFGIEQGNDPDSWFCHTCKPRPGIEKEKERADRVQKKKRELREAKKKEAAASGGIGGAVRLGPADESAPWLLEFVQIDKTQVQGTDAVDIVTSLTSRDDVEVARIDRFLSRPPQAGVKPVPLSTSSFTIPAYALHATSTIPADTYVALFTGIVTTSAAYLANPINQYTHLGIPKRFVRLFPPPIDVAIDARKAGSEARFARSGCHPNAVLKPAVGPDGLEDSEIIWALFTTTEIKSGDEIVLPWEWDDGHVVHRLPSMIEERLKKNEM